MLRRCAEIFSTVDPTTADIGFYPLTMTTSTLAINVPLIGSLTQVDTVDYSINNKFLSDYILAFKELVKEDSLKLEPDFSGIRPKVKNIKLTISIDGHRELNHMIRRGSDWNLLKSNIELVKNELDNLDVIKGTTCISGLNAQELGETVEAIVFELGIHWHTSRVQWPDFLHANVLSPEQLQTGIDGLKRVFDSLNTPERWHTDRRFMLETHIKGAISWLQSAIDDNRHETKIN